MADVQDLMSSLPDDKIGKYGQNIDFIMTTQKITQIFQICWLRLVYCNNKLATSVRPSPIGSPTDSEYRQK